MDSIQIQGIRSYGYTGYLKEEQTLGQWFEVDVTLWLDLSQAGMSDAIADTLDYRDTIETVQNKIKTCKYDLIERLTSDIAETLLQQSKVQQVKVQLRKLTPPIPDFSGSIQIEITKIKSDF
ncbi:MAG: dihydroneopterin aldolase [Microcoleaceae cyanobacterium]